MSETLGKCSVCGDHASVVYPLLGGSPGFCGVHHNQADAGRFGCDFSGPDDFDIPDYDDSFQVEVWHTKDGDEILVEDLEDSHLHNIIALLKRNEQNIFTEIWIDALEDEQGRRAGK